jgi:large subunit ribosomal protein L33
MREIIKLRCTKCKKAWYSTTKNKRLHPDRIEQKKYCRFDREHTTFKEAR